MSNSKTISRVNMMTENAVARNKEVTKFISHARTVLDSDGVKFILSPTKYLVINDEGYSKCNGFFLDGDEPELKCAVDRPIRDWLPVLVHEFSHYQQWKEDCPSWRHLEINGRDVGEDMFSWVSGKRMTRKRIRESIHRVRNNELDCEKRAVKNIIRFKLPMDIKKYTQGANAYVYFHEYVYLTRNWYKKDHTPYELKSVVSQMPTKFMSRYDRLPLKIRNIFDEHCS